VSVVDTSALFAVLQQEPDALRYSQAIERDPEPAMSAATLLEAGAIALGRGGAPLLSALRKLFSESGVEIIPFDAGQAVMAIEAYRRYGRGVGRPGCLNLGDCFSYALAKARAEPLLFKGNDFARTDVQSAL
jgi:ribonuclease VapC